MSLEIDEHRQYWTDSNRVAPLSAAIQAVVKPGDVVLDLACGTGILGLFACRAGAARVYSIDSGGMAAVARSLAAANGYADRMQVIKGFSTLIDLPERADVIIADQIGNFGFNAGSFEFYADAFKRLLKPGARTMPRSIQMVVAPWDSAALHANVAVWGTNPHGFNTAPVLSLAENTGYQCDLDPAGRLGAAVASPAFVLDPPIPGPLRFSGASVIERPGLFHGLGGWFHADLAPSVTMTNDPASARCIKRRQIFLPFHGVPALEPGDLVAVDLIADPLEVMVNARVRITSPSGTVKFTGRHSTFRGMLLPEEVRRRTNPQFRPKLSRRGLARRFAIDQFDGVKTLEEIGTLVQAAYPDLFPDAVHATVFATEISSGYAE